MPEQNYFEQIQLTWQRHQGKSLILSPVDWGYMEAWQEAGIPLTAVLLGIERSFENFKPKSPGERINTLRYCWPEILKAASEMSVDTYWERRRTEKVGLKHPRPFHRGKKYL